jgi:hypothetical protein
MAVTADGDDGVWPVQPDASYQTAQMGTDFPAVRRFTGTQDRDDAMTGRGIIHVDRCGF